MKNIKICVSLLLCICFIFSAVACGQSEAVSENEIEEKSSVAESSAPVEESSEEVSYEPDTRDLNGREITFLVAGSAYGNYESFEIYAEELNDEPINDAVFNRNQIVQDKLNCVILEEKSNQVAQDMATYVSTGVNYDVYMPYINDAVKLIDSDIMYDLNQFEDLNLTADWWDQKANEGLTIKNKLYMTTGDISILDNECTMVMFFNKKLVEQYSLDNPYTLVEEHKWTLDKAYEMSAGFSENLGDSVWDNQDKYGLHVAFNAPHSFYFGCGGTITGKDSSGDLYLNMNTESNINILNKVFDISYKDDVVTNKTKGCSTWEDICQMFLNDQIIFTTLALTDLKSFRSTYGFEYGILPYPLFDENQEEYHCLVSTSLVPGVCIPTDAANPEDIALVLENMAYYSSIYVTPAYYEITLKSKDLGDEESEKMLDIIFSSRVYDLGYIYNFGGVGGLIEKMNNINSRDFVSNYQAIESKAESALEDIMENLS